MIVLWIILCVIAIAVVVGMVAVIADSGRESTHKPNGPYERFVKRGLDAFLATGAMIAMSPVLLVIAALVKVNLGSPVLFLQARPGKDEKIFKLYKFRSMTNLHDENGELLPDDVRLTKFGRILRSTSLDELPELFNIIKGDLAVIGPRPLLVDYLPYYSKEERHRHDVRPGLSGLAQVNGRNMSSWEQTFSYDLQYVKRITFLGDLKILCQTVFKVIKRADIAQGFETIGRFDEYRHNQDCEKN